MHDDNVRVRHQGARSQGRLVGDTRLGKEVHRSRLRYAGRQERLPNRCPISREEGGLAQPFPSGNRGRRHAYRMIG